MPSSCCCCIVAPEQRQIAKALGLRSREPVEPDSEEARQRQGLRGSRTLKLTSESCDSLVLSVHVLRPRCPSAHSKHRSSLSPQEDRPPSHGVRDRTGSVPNPKDFPIPNGTRIPFSIILPDVPPLARAPPRDCTTYGLERQGAPSDSVGLARTTSPSPQSSRAGFLVERRLLLLLAARCLMLTLPAMPPCHATR